MKAFDRLSGRVVPLDKANVDTDQIIPKQFLKSIRRTGFGDNLFDAWRYLDEGDPAKTPNEREINPDFVLNQPRYQGACMLLARENFGCGSSREHAVWALEEYGLRVILAPSYADIFFNNCFKNGVLPIVLEEKKIDELFAIATAEQGLELTVDLAAQTVELPSGEKLGFDIEAFRKRCLLEGLDDIGVTLTEAEAIREFERGHRQRAPWLFAAE